MRPVRKGPSPQSTAFAPYTAALPDLVARLGIYCSYCERRISTNLAVEHIQPKGLPAYAHLVGSWENYLLGCVNCNSTKKDKDVVLVDTLLPDRDNTFAAFEYHADGTLTPSPVATAHGLKPMAQATLALTGLDKRGATAVDANEKIVALERISQRMEAWGTAEITRGIVIANPGNEALKRLAVTTALATGFFSVWMTVFQGDVDMCARFVDAFDGTRASGCFDPVTSQPVLPAPNPDHLPGGGKL